MRRLPWLFHAEPWPGPNTHHLWDVTSEKNLQLVDACERDRTSALVEGMWFDASDCLDLIPDYGDACRDIFLIDASDCCMAPPANSLIVEWSQSNLERSAPTVVNAADYSVVATWAEVESGTVQWVVRLSAWIAPTSINGRSVRRRTPATQPLVSFLKVDHDGKLIPQAALEHDPGWSCPEQSLMRFATCTQGDYSQEMDNASKSSLVLLGVTYPAYVVYKVLELLHCRNVTLDRAPLGARERKQLRRATGAVRGDSFHTVKIDGKSPREWGRVPRSSGDPSTRLHRVRGHYAHYTEEKPLFGKYVGKVLRRSHVRGCADLGWVDKKYVGARKRGASASCSQQETA